jgi:HPt (histidine-containing phosphotransfer) domain-containing protein
MNAFDERMQQLRARFAERSLRERDELGAAMAAGDHATAIRVLHSLAGNAGMFGYPRLSTAARQFEVALESLAAEVETGRMLQEVMDEFPEHQRAGADEAE